MRPTPQALWTLWEHIPSRTRQPKGLSEHLGWPVRLMPTGRLSGDTPDRNRAARQCIQPVHHMCPQVLQHLRLRRAVRQSSLGLAQFRGPAASRRHSHRPSTCPRQSTCPMALGGAQAGWVSVPMHSLPVFPSLPEPVQRRANTSKAGLEAAVDLAPRQAAAAVVVRSAGAQARQSRDSPKRPFSFSTSPWTSGWSSL